ncbi:PilZ domain-containing protein [Comamonas flocculans]|uniref:Pilus assembly protein PilZ n=1 Tax=Comamonas flocculans TaxID=2597701 RepID=A0A5B8S051_9BURK|nr:PilZ domain-containing protein [Comamonas flocculans]QEA13627.1 pilus assembly protein PilZ [Comamonas flocculans]
MATPANAPRPSVMQLNIKDKTQLFMSYIRLFKEGGIFVPTTREYRLGDDVYVLLSLPEQAQRYPVAGKVAWINPARVGGGRVQGVGVRFPDDEKSHQLKAKIEELLGSALGADRQTQTL